MQAEENSKPAHFLKFNQIKEVAKRIANIRLTIYRMKRKENKKYGYRGIKK